METLRMVLAFDECLRRPTLLMQNRSNVTQSFHFKEAFEKKLLQFLAFTFLGFGYKKAMFHDSQALTKIPFYGTQIL